MISTSVPYMPIFNDAQYAQSDGRPTDPARPDPLHLLSRDSIRRTLKESALPRPEPHPVASETNTPKILAGSVMVSMLGAAGLVAHIVREHMQAKRKAAQTKSTVHLPVVR